MHFKTDSSSSYIIKNASNTPSQSGNNHISVCSKEKHSGKFNQSKDVSNSLVLLAQDNQPLLISYKTITFIPRIPDSYDYHFFKEINPPPPKGC
jgi:hypothetical protein